MAARKTADLTILTTLAEIINALGLDWSDSTSPDL